MPAPSSTASTAPTPSVASEGGWAGPPLVAALVLGLAVTAIHGWLGAIEPSWDVLERSDILAHWSTTPRTHRSFPSHVLELWLARPLHALFAGPGRETAGLRALGSLSVGTLAALLTWVGGRRGGWALVRSIGCAACICFAAGCLTLGASGEEKMVAATSLCVAAAGLAWLIRDDRAGPWQAAVVGVACAAAVLVHLTNGVLLVGIAAGVGATWLPGVVQPTRPRRSLAVAGIVATGIVVLGYTLLAYRWYPDAPQPFAAAWDAITAYHGPQGVARDGTITTGWAAVVGAVPGAAWAFVIVAASPLVLLIARSTRDASQWPLAALAAAATAAWCWNFSTFEPQNPESWLGLWCFGGLLWALWFTRPGRDETSRLRTSTAAASLLIALTIIVGNRALFGARSNAARTWAEGVEAACGLQAMLLTTGKEFRAARLYTDLRVVEAGELFGTPVEYTGRSPTPPSEVDRHRGRARVCVSSSAAAVLAPVRPRLQRRVEGRVTVFVLTSDLEAR